MKQKTGYIAGIFHEISYEIIMQLQQCKKYCDKLIVGIPSDELYGRITRRIPIKEQKEIKQGLQCLNFIDEIIIIDESNYKKTVMWETLHFDICFVGTEYGRLFQQEKLQLEQKGVELMPILSEVIMPINSYDAFGTCLEDIFGYKKIVLFGTGTYFKHYMKSYGEKYPPAYAIDNMESKWGTKIEGVDVKSPKCLKDENPKETLVVLCCKNYDAVKQQLLSMGDYDYRIMRNTEVFAILDEYIAAYEEELEYLKESQRVLTILMKEMDRVCRKYDLKYYVISGSLIGVVRHQGMIPWDDDIDIAMCRKDYEILKEKASEIWGNSDFYLATPEKLGKGVFLDFMTRLVYMKERVPTRVFKKVDGKTEADLHHRVVLDIYVLDEASDNKMLHGVVTTAIKGLYALAMGHRAYVDFDEYDRLSKLSLIGVKVAVGIGRLIPLRLILWLYNRLCRYAGDNNHLCFESNGVINYMPWLYEKELYGEGTRLPMQDMQVMVPADYDGLLLAKGYKNYMQFPPAYGRRPSHYAKAKGIIW